MEIKEGKLYFIKDEFIDKYNSKYQLMKNKDKGSKRPTYFCMRDIHNRDMLWFIPMSTQYDKNMKKYIEIKEKIKKEPNNFVLANNIAGRKAVFLLQNMFPTIEKYIIEEYKRNGQSISIPPVIVREIEEKARDIFALTKRGFIVTFTNLPEFIKDIKKELMNK